MDSAQSRQIRLEKKRARRRQKRRQGVSGPVQGEQKYSMRWFVSPEGLEPDRDCLAEVPATLMSDTLVELMEPYIRWPPGRTDLDDLEDWLELGAAVWNVTVKAKDSAACSQGLAQLATELEAENAARLVEEIARRKFCLFPMDGRRVLAVRVAMKGDLATVEAATSMRVPGVRR